MPTKAFTFKHTVFFNETNAMGGVVYFANFVKWQGMVREAFFMQEIPSWKEIMYLVTDGSANMITVEEHSHFKRNANFGDTIIIKLQTANLRKCSFDLVFTMFRNTEAELLYEGWQRLTFSDRDGAFIPVPEPIRGVLLHYGIQNGEYHKRYARKDQLMQQASTAP